MRRSLVSIFVVCGLLVSGTVQAALVAQYGFEQVDPLQDDTGNGNTLTSGGSPAVTFSSPANATFTILGTSCSNHSGNGGCPGSNPSYLDVPTSVDGVLSDFTITMLARKTSSNDNYQTVVSSDVFRFQHQSGHRLGINVTGGGGGAQSAAGTFPDDEWQFVTLTYRASDNLVQGYIAPADGSVTGTSFSFTASNDNLDSATGFRLGSDGRSFIGCYDPFGGQIDQVRFYDDYKATAQVRSIFQGYVNPLMVKYSHEATNPLTDDTGNGYDATNAGGVSFVAPPSPGAFQLGDEAGAYPRTGTGYLNVPFPHEEGHDFTFTAFVRKNSDEVGGHQTILATDRFRFQYRDTGDDYDGSGTLRLDVNGAGASGTGESGDGTFNTEEWYFVALRYDSSTHLIDAFLQPGNDITLTGPAFTRTANGTIGIDDMSAFRLGYDGLSGIGGADAFGGWMDEAHFYSAWLSDAQLEALFQSYVPEPSTVAMLVSLGIAGLIGLVRRRRS